MKLFLIFNLLIFAASITLVLYSFINYPVFLNLPISYKILILMGIVTPLSNIYDVIKNFVKLSILLSTGTIEEE